MYYVLCAKEDNNFIFLGKRQKGDINSRCQYRLPTAGEIGVPFSPPVIFCPFSLMTGIVGGRLRHGSEL